MKQQLRGLFLAVSCGALLAAGCAKQEVIKKDQGIAPAASPAPSAPVPSKPAPEAVKAVQPQPMEKAPIVQETPLESDAQKAAKQEAALKNGLQKIYFNFDSPALSEEARTTLTRNAELLKKSPTAKIRVEGNCDERGSDDYNLALGEKRAKEAVQYLVNLGIPAKQLTAISYGKEKPAAAGHDEANWAKNRRDEFVVVK